MESAESGGSHSKAASARKLIASAMRSADVSFDARGLFVLISGFANADGSRCYPGIDLLTKLSGHDRKWVVRHLAELRLAGWLTSITEPGPKGRRNRYTLHWGNIGPEAE